MAGPIRISILANASQARKEITGVASTTESSMGHARKAVGALVGAFVGFAVVSKVTNVLKDSLAEAREAQKVGAQTAAVIKSTGGAANVSAKQVGDLSTAISNKTGIDDEAIQVGANMILTFKNIRNEAGKNNDVFNQATQTVTDMSAAMGTPMKNSAILVGKALNDPIKGLSALSRVGVTFTKQQQKQIKGMVDSGHSMGAQKIILKELSSEFGGSAAAQATAGDKLRTTWKNVEEEIGTKLLPILDRVEIYVADHLPQWMAMAGDAVDKVKAAFEQVEPTIETVIGFIKDNPETVKTFAVVLGILVGAIVLVTGAMAALDAVMAINPFVLVAIALATLAAALVYAYKHSKTFAAIVDASFGFIKKVVPPVITFVVGFVKDHWKALLVLLGGPIGLATVLIVKNFDKIVAAVKAAGAIARWLWNNAFQPALKFIVNGISFLMDTWAKMLHALGHVPGFGWANDAGDAMQNAADKARGLANAIRDIPATKRIDLNIYTHHIGVHGQTNLDLVGNSSGGSGRGSAKLALTASDGGGSRRQVNVTVNAPVGADGYTIGETLKGYLDTYLNGVPA